MRERRWWWRKRVVERLLGGFGLREFGVGFLAPEQGLGDGEGAEAEFLGDAEFAEAKVVFAQRVGEVAAGKGERVLYEK
jgi:hypothetical protein